MRMQLTIFKKGLILVSVPLFFQLIFFGLIADMQRTNANAAAWSIHYQQRLLWIGAGISFVVTFGLALFFSQNISQRLGTLMGNAKRIVQGMELAPPIPGTDEVAQLDQAFRSMAEDLAKSTEAQRTSAQEVHALYQKACLSEQAIRKLNNELEERIAERTKELSETNRELLQKNKENETFVYSVSHDLRSPLVNLEGFSKELSLVAQDLRTLLEDPKLPEAIRQRGVALIDADMAEAIRFIQSSVRRMSAIIDALLRLSRAGRLEYQPQRVDLNALVGRIISAMTGTIHQKGAQVKVQDLPPLRGDPTATEQVFANLLGNALNYLDPKRPGIVEVGSVASGDDNGFQTYFVKDNGLGIDPAYHQKVFQVFQRVHPDAAPGEGLGLAIVRRIVERHGGRVWLESKAGEGSTFFVAFPTS